MNESETTGAEPDNLAEIIDIQDPEINVEDIMRRIRADAKRLQAQVGDTSGWPSYGTAPFTASADDDLYEHVRRAFATHDKLYVELILTRRNRLSDLPLVGTLRRAFHGLVIFYVNTLASKQTLFNTQVVHALNRLTEGQAAGAAQADLAALQETVRRLEQRLAEVEDQLAHAQGDGQA